MVVLSFSLDCLWKPVLTGTKRCSMRPVWVKDEKTKQIRKSAKWPAVVKKYDQGLPVELSLGWKTRSKDGFMLFNVDLMKIGVKKLGDLSLDEWNQDGIATIEEGAAFFKSHYPYYKELEGRCIEEFEIYRPEWKAGSCATCAYKEICPQLEEKKYMKEWNKFQIQWSDGSECCTGYRRHKKTEYPMLTNLFELQDQIGVRPHILYPYWVEMHCEKCQNLYQKTASTVIIDHKEQVSCLADESRFCYPSDMDETDLHYLITTQNYHRKMGCADFAAGTPTIEYYDYHENEEDDEYE